MSQAALAAYAEGLAWDEAAALDGVRALQLQCSCFLGQGCAPLPGGQGEQLSKLRGSRSLTV